MIRLSFLLALQFLAAASYSQLATLDTFLLEGQVHHLVGISHLASGDIDKAIDELNLATLKLRDVQNGLHITTDSLINLSRIWHAESPVSPVYKYLYGRALQYPGVDSPDTIQSKRLFYEALEIEPRFLWPYLGLASPYLIKADYPSAISLYHKAISVDSAFGPAYNALVEAYTKSFDTSNATKMEYLLFSRYPRSWDANLRRGLKAAGESDIVKKGSLYRDIIRFAEDDELLAGAYNGLLRIAFESESTDFDTLKSLVLQLPGIQFRKPKQSAYLYTFARARKEGWSHIRSLTEEVLRTTDIYLLNVLGKYHADSLHDNREALIIFQRGLEVCTRENAYNTVISGVFSDQQLDGITERYRASLSYRLGLICVSLGLDQDAEQYLIRAAMGADGSRIVDANFQLGSLFVKSNDSEDAIRWLSRGLALQYDDHAMALLSELIGSEPEAKAEIQKFKSTAEHTAPDFELSSIEGDTIRLSSYRGKVVLISFWAIWCRPCVLELPHLRKIAERYMGSPHVTLLSINMDQPVDSVAEFVSRNDFKMRVLYDRGTSLKYGVEGIPTIMIIDRRGNVMYKHVGFSGDGDAFARAITAEIEGLLSQ